jgi:hypothetical protein
MVLFDVSVIRPKQDDDAAEAAIRAISKTLSALNPDARMRVLQWANERFSPALDVAADPSAGENAAADPTLSLEGLQAFFEPVTARQEAHDAPQPIEPEDMGDLFDDAVHRKAELRVVARRETPSAVALEDLHDLYENAVAQDHPEPEASIGDLYEQTAAGYDAGEVDEPIADLYDSPALQHFGELDVTAAVVDEAPAEAPLEEVQAPAAAVAAEDQSLDTLVADFASALHSLTLQFKDVSA